MADKVLRWKQVRYHWEIYLFVIPTLVTIGLFIYYPATSGIFHSFFRWNGADIAEPQGLYNYKDLLFSGAFWRSFKNAFTLGIWNVVKMLPPLFVAVAIHRCKSTRLQFFYRALFVVPMVIPPLVVALIWRSFFFEATNGFLNVAIDALHLERILAGLSHLCWLSPDNYLLPWGEAFGPAPWDRVARAAYEAATHSPPAWLGDPNLIMTACIVWGFPWISSLAVLTHLAKLQGIPKDLYEAAEIDGASHFRQMRMIVLPLSGPILGTVGVMHFMTAVKG